MLFIILLLVLLIPSVQTSLGAYATKKINSKYGTDIRVEKLGLQLNGDLELKNILIKDHHNDTLIAVKELNSSILNFTKLNDNKLLFGDIDLYGLRFHIKTYRGEKDSNLDIFVESFEDNKKKKSSTPFELSSDDITISNSHFLLTDENKADSKRILDFQKLDINVTDFLILGPEVSTQINGLSFSDPRGVEMHLLQTNFKYSLSSMRFQNLKIQTINSKLEGNLVFQYKREDLKYFSDKVTLNANFKKSTLNLGELNVFFPEFGASENVTFDTNITGTLNNLSLQDFQLKSNRNTFIDGQFNLVNLIDSKSKPFQMTAQIDRLTSKYSDLKRILPRILGENIPTNLSTLGVFTLQGTTQISGPSIAADFEASTELGWVIADLNLSKIESIDNAQYQGTIQLEDFDLGTLINQPNFGHITSDFVLKGKGFTLEKLHSNITGSCAIFEVNKYIYKNLNIEGFVENKIFNGSLAVSDENLKMDFKGLVNFSDDENIYDFSANIQNANLNELNLVSRDSISVFQGKVSMDMKGTNIDNVRGFLKFNNTSYKNQNDDYYFKDFQVLSDFDINGIRTISVNSPEIIRGTFKGKFIIKEIPKMLKNSLREIYSQYSIDNITPNQSMDFNFKIYNKIIEVFYPNLQVGANTYVRGTLYSNPKKFSLKFKSPNISIEDYFAKKIEIQLINDNPIFNTYVELDSLNTPFYSANDFSLINLTVNDTLYIKSEFKGGKQNEDTFDFNLFYTKEGDNSAVGLKPSFINFKSVPWKLNALNNSKNKLVFDADFNKVSILDMDISHMDEKLILSAQAQDSLSGNLNLKFNNVDLAKVTPEIDSLQLGGTINGDLNIIKQNKIYIPKSLLTIDDFEVNKFNLGAFNADIKGNTSLTNYDVNISLKDDKNETFSALGNLDVSGKNSNLDLKLEFKDFLLDPIGPFGNGVITNIRGKVTGNSRITGRLQRPQINGILRLNQGGMSVPYLNIDYAFADNTRVDLESQSFVFKSAQFTDTTFSSEGILNGTMSHTNFSDWALDLDIDSNRLLVLNTKETEESLYYGTGFVEGNINVSGPMNQLFIEANVTTSEGTIFKIPLNDSEMISENSYIKFLSPKEKLKKTQGRSIKLDEIEGVEMEFNMDVTDDAEIEIVIDKETGSSIRGRGNGSMLAQINTNDKFLMFGDFLVLSGYYNYSLGQLIQKKFKLVKDGSLVWEGDPLQAEINLEAIYDGINVNPSVLLDNPINQTIPVEVVTNLRGALEKPDLEFDLRFPNINSALNSELKDRLRDKDKRDFQALSLLATGSFRSKLALDSQDAFELVSDGVTNVLNDIFSDEENKVKLGLDLDIGKNTPEFETDSRVGVTLSTKISDNVLINGKVGVPVGGVSETTVAGDFEVQVLLNEDRTLSLKFFNRENSIQNFGEQIGYTQGLGVSYNIEFDNLRELFKELFSKNNKKEDTQDKKSTDKSLLPDYMEFKQ
ncbi:MAG: translocation/assembly module TamB domain-containing protein [Flavobacteriaceae bacterium]